MKKNGSYFLSVIDSSDLRSGVWDPYAYRDGDSSETFGQFATVRRVAQRKGALPKLGSYAPIEYRHIHSGTLPIFSLQRGAQVVGRVPAVEEESLLFGTMRAYLGNALVTPRAGWIDRDSPMLFPVKSEFVRVEPKDTFVYFWWAFLQSPEFLHTLPVGSGGTRPRLDVDHLVRTPVQVPSKSARRKIHDTLSQCAQRAWQDYVRVETLLDTTFRHG